LTAVNSLQASVKELWHYRELFFFLVWRDVKIRYKQSLLGVLWAILQPFGTMIVFTLLFHRVIGISSGDGTPYPIFSYAALLPWTYFSQAVSHSGQSLVGNRDLLTKVYFPRVTIPAASAMRGLVDFACASVMLAALIAYYHLGGDANYPNFQFSIHAKLLLWPALVLLLLVLSLGIGMTLGALNVRYRDVQYVLPFTLQLWMFLTPIIYPISRLPEAVQPYAAINPMAGIIEAFRASLIPSRSFDWTQLAISAAVTLVIFLIGAWYFHRTARDFADVV